MAKAKYKKNPQVVLTLKPEEAADLTALLASTSTVDFEKATGRGMTDYPRRDTIQDIYNALDNLLG